VTTKGVREYVPKELNGYDITFYTGFNPQNRVPLPFMSDVYTTQKPVVWISTGFIEFCQQLKISERFGFRASIIDSSQQFTIVHSGGKVFQRQEMSTTIVTITNSSLVDVIATAYSPTRRREIPYIVRSRNLLYIADSPFAYAAGSDRYLLFADMLHDLLHCSVSEPTGQKGAGS
jgi:uncharacterized protein YdaL